METADTLIGIVENCIYRWKPKYKSIKMAEATRQWSVEVKDA